jgi:TRAP-type mannitol/chloroaromatic compound transport system substrate-binding protein
MDTSRRHWLAATSAGLAATALGGCAQTPVSNPTGGPTGTTKWRMATSWPTSLPLLHECALDFAQTVGRLTNGALQIDVVDPSQHGKPVGVLDLVASGEFELGHTTAQYYAAAVPAIDFFTAIPFGLLPTEQHAWLNEGGGQALFDEALAPKGVLAMPAGSTGVQMGGWFMREIRRVEDLQGLRIRIAGFPGKVLARLGAKPIGLPLGQIAKAFADGAIDAADIVGPAIDETMGVQAQAQFCHAPWHELDVVLHLMVNRARWLALPDTHRQALREAGAACSLRSMARAQHRNALAMNRLRAAGVVFKTMPGAVISALKEATRVELDAAARADALTGRVVASLRAELALLSNYASASDQPALALR